MDTQNTQNEKPCIVINKENDFFDFYFGTNEGKKMMDKLADAKKSIKIVSPYISVSTTEDLIYKRIKGVNDIRVITAYDEQKNNDEQTKAFRNLIHRFSYLDDGYDFVIDTVVFKKDFHLKLYIIDEEIVFSGSFNFTNSGIKTNIESAVTIKDPKIISDIILYFDELHDTNSLEKWDLTELGKIIYPFQSK
jgi:phosphatidylserine/phosphatidylglycerophosphate/cardiolipin synthase-like enzyme